MADIEIDLYDAYESSLNTNKALTLSWMKFFQIPNIPSDLRKWYGALPIVFFWCENITLESTCMDGEYRVDEKLYRFHFAIVAQVFDKSRLTKSSSVPDKRKLSEYRESFEALYAREDFDISNAATLVSVQNEIVSIPGIQIAENDWVDGVELIIEHDWIDQRAPV
jgi:hypothetical protein